MDGQKNQSIDSVPDLQLSYIEIDNDTKKNIDEYIRENRLANVKAVIVLSIRNSGNIKNIFITHTENVIPRIEKLPYIVSLYKNKIIYVYTGIEQFVIQNENLKIHLSKILQANGYLLNGKYVLEHNKVWWVRECDGYIKVFKSVYFETELPCDYYVYYINNVPFLKKIEK